MDAFAIQVATVLNSTRAVEMSVYVVRAFVKLRDVLVSNRELARKLAELERSLTALDLEIQRQFREVYETIRFLMGAPVPKRRPPPTWGSSPSRNRETSSDVGTLRPCGLSEITICNRFRRTEQRVGR